MDFLPLASSSAGNAYLAESGGHRILLECGVSFRRLQTLTGFGVAEIDACFLSHEHRDHSRCCNDIIKSGIPLYATEGTALALALLEAECLERSGASAPGGSRRYAQVSVAGFDVVPFQTFHDAKEPVGFLIRSQADGEILLFATDTADLQYELPAVTIAALECNWSEELLTAATRIPDRVKRRITLNHLSRAKFLSVLDRLDKSRLREVWLLHMGGATSDEAAWTDLPVPPGVRVRAAPKERR